ncbi:hypothetical protein HYS28_00140 [Candidatus Uhrbacteria bacterium]|nr:hypothetical protein [Candidatus Uhrbacteria bacterium]
MYPIVAAGVFTQFAEARALLAMPEADQRAWLATRMPELEVNLAFELIIEATRELVAREDSRAPSKPGFDDWPT